MAKFYALVERDCVEPMELFPDGEVDHNKVFATIYAMLNGASAGLTLTLRVKNGKKMRQAFKVVTT